MINLKDKLLNIMWTHHVQHTYILKQGGDLRGISLTALLAGCHVADGGVVQVLVVAEDGGARVPADLATADPDRHQQNCVVSGQGGVMCPVHSTPL